MFTNCYNQGVQFTFANGLTISIQWGAGNYCQNRSFEVSPFNAPRDIFKCSDAEIAIWDGNDKSYQFGNGTCKGWVSTDEVAQWIIEVSTAKSLSDIMICE
jgi:hypothetical protein